MPDIQHHKQNQTDIINKEARRIPRHKRREALREDDQDVEEEPVPAEPWLPEGFEGKVVAGDALGAAGAHEGEVGGVDAGPCC